jgi:hypothetical protein
VHALHGQNVFSINRAAFKIMWKNLAELDKPQITINIQRGKYAFFLPDNEDNNAVTHLSV